MGKKRENDQEHGEVGRKWGKIEGMGGRDRADKERSERKGNRKGRNGMGRKGGEGIGR